MNHFVSRWVAAALLLTVFAFSLQSAKAATITVGLTSGHNFDGPGGINSAVAAAADGDQIHIMDAGEYSSVTLLGGKAYSVIGMVNGVEIRSSSSLNNVAACTMVSSHTAAGPFNVHLENLKLTNRNEGNNGIIRIQLHQTQPTTFTMTDVEVIQDIAFKANGTSQQNNRAIYLVQASSNNTPGYFNFTDCTIQGGIGGGNAILCNPNNSWGGLQIDLLRCNLISNTQVVWTEARDNQVWNVMNCDILSSTSEGMRIRRPHSNAQFNFVDTSIHCRGSAVRTNSASDSNGNNNRWFFNRCLLENVTYNTLGTGDRLTRIEYAGTTTGNVFDFYNCLMMTGPRSNTINARPIYQPGPGKATVLYCTLVGANADQTTTTQLLPNAGVFNSGGGTADVFNTIFLHFENPVNGTVSAAKGNLIAGPQDDDALGADRVHVFSTTGSLEAAKSAIGLVGHYEPGSGSQARDTAVTSAVLLAAIDNFDKNGLIRGVATDKGAFEANATPVELSNFAIE